MTESPQQKPVAERALKPKPARVVSADAAGSTRAVARPPVKKKSWLQSASWWLFIVLAAVLGTDWFFPMRGRFSVLLAALVSVLAIPWTVQVLKSDAQQTALDDAALGTSRVHGSRLFHVGVLLLAAGFLFGKWMLLYYSQGEDQHFVGPSQTYSVALGVVMAFGLAGRGLRVARFMAVASEHPARLMALSFGLTGLAGALLLSLPISLESMERASLVDSLFMAFSAVCVTGLSVTHVPETYTIFGQAVLCALVQTGGLGIMVLSSAVAILAGQRLRVKSSAVLAEMVDASSLASLRRTIAVICCYTLLIEAIGAFILYGQFQAYPEILMRYGHDLAGPGSVLWAAIFHSVNAFCNAGFSNVYAGLVPFVSNQFIMLAIVALVLLGGIGFPVLDELGRVLFLKLRRRRAPMLSLNTRVALRTSGLLLVGMALSYVILEWTASMKNLAYPDRITAALFQSAAARSAGFNVIDVAAMRPAALVLTCAAMFVGASPGGAGGGIKTTTLAALYSGLRAELSGKAPTLLNRRLPDSVIRKAIGVAFLSIVIVTTAFFLLLLLEPHAPLDLAFETISAFSTTGLSTGITPKLSVPGKLLITFMMFIGRIGPLTLALAVSVRPRERAVEMPEERVMIG